MRAPSALPFALAAVAFGSVASSVPAAQDFDPRDPLHCVAEAGEYELIEQSVADPYTVATGVVVFHSVALNCGCERSGVSFLFDKAGTDSYDGQGYGISAVVRDDDPGHIHLLMMLGDEQRPMGDYAYGEPVPFKISFDDDKGTMRVESGKFAMTAKPPRRERALIHIPCISADVSVTQFDVR